MHSFAEGTAVPQISFVVSRCLENNANLEELEKLQKEMQVGYRYCVTPALTSTCPFPRTDENESVCMHFPTIELTDINILISYSCIRVLQL